MKKTLPVMWITLKFIKINRIKTQETRGADNPAQRYVKLQPEPPKWLLTVSRVRSLLRPQNLIYYYN